MVLEHTNRYPCSPYQDQEQKRQKKFTLRTHACMIHPLIHTCVYACRDMMDKITLFLILENIYLVVEHQNAVIKGVNKRKYTFLLSLWTQPRKLKPLPVDQFYRNFHSNNSYHIFPCTYRLIIKETY